MTRPLNHKHWPPQEWVKTQNVETLNEIFTPLPFMERIKRLYQYFPKDKVLVTSSFGTKSVFLLHLISTINPDQRIHFINTTYHFPETLEYKETLTRLLDLKLVEVLPGEAENQLTREEKWWIDHPRMCCSINKIAPLEPVIADHTVWMSGLMAYQTKFRSHLRVFEQQGDIIKFHPFIDIDEGEFLYHLSFNKLPRHPLEDKGFGSIGCLHCTRKGEGRSGRWKDKVKTECGLHPNFFQKNRKVQTGGNTSDQI